MIIINDKISEQLVFDDGFYFGKALFETILVLEKPVFLKEHLERLNKGLELLKINKKITGEYINRVISEKEIKNQVLKITVSVKNIVINTRPITYTDEEYKNGFKLCFSEVIRNSTSMLSYVKSVNYIENIIEKEKAMDKGFQEVIFANEHGKICEGSCSNIFFIKNKNIYTPKVSCGILTGVVRAWVINNYKVEEGEYDINNLLESDEIFITNSIMGIMKVKTLNDRVYDDQITKGIMDYYFKTLDEDYR